MLKNKFIIQYIRGVNKFNIWPLFVVVSNYRPVCLGNTHSLALFAFPEVLGLLLRQS